MMAKKGLGRGLDALLGDFSATPPAGVTEVDIRLLDINKSQPRKDFDEAKLTELCESIKLHGLMQPILVRQTGERYSIVAGERRYRAARMAGLDTIPVIVKEVAPEEVMELALIENLQREDLNPIEEASAIRFLMQQHDLTQEEVSKRLSKSRPAIANTLRLLMLPESVQQLLREGKLTSGHARALAGLKDEKLQEKLAQETVEKDHSVRELEALVQKLQQDKLKAQKEPKRLPNELYRAQESFQSRLGTKVQISGSESRGRITIEYYSREDLQHIYDIINGE